MNPKKFNPANLEPTDLKEDEDGKYFVTFDPLDGSSNIDSNITIGTIFCIYKVDNKNLKTMILGDVIVASGYCLYGGSTQLVLGDKNNGVNLYVMDRINNNFQYVNYGNNIADDWYLIDEQK